MFDIEKFRSYCLKKKGVSEEFPFGPETLVFKVAGKMFALTGLDSDEFSINLKCNAEQMVDWRSKYPAVQPGYHMNKAHWNTVLIDGSIRQKEIEGMIDHSYDEVVRGMTKKMRQELNNL
ncbi:MAG: MmcQ/YjbR family DNA-binding protein [Chitinophagales bacterium]